MKRNPLSHSLLAAASLISLCSAGTAHAQPAQVPLTGTVRTESPADAVARAQRDLERQTELHKLGRAPEEDVVRARIRLAEARLRLPTTPHAEVLTELERLVALREEGLKLATARYEAGQTPVRELNAARIVLAEARIRLELNRLVTLAEEDLAIARQAFEAGLVREQEVVKATKALAKARQRLATDQSSKR